MALMEKYMYFNVVINKNNKLGLYYEMLVKCYIITNRKSFNDISKLLESKIYYDFDKTIVFYKALKRYVYIQRTANQCIVMSEKIKYSNERKQIWDEIVSIVG